MLIFLPIFAKIGISDKANNILVPTISVYGKISQSIEMVTLASWSSQSLCPGSSITDKGMVVMMISKTQTKNLRTNNPQIYFTTSSPYLFSTAYQHSYHTITVLGFGGFVLFFKVVILQWASRALVANHCQWLGTSISSSVSWFSFTLVLYSKCLSSILTCAQVTHWSSFGIFPIKSSHYFVILILFSFSLSSAIS